jgi:KaiC/GvpD/RAD55 family RecA-like ATPase
MMFKNTVNGLDRILHEDFPKGSVILVTGGEGTLKSSLVFSIISNYLDGKNESGIYATLEQTKESHLKSMDGLGIKRCKNLHVFDYWDMRMEWKERELDVLKITEEIIDFYKDKQETLTVFALDSLNALYSLASGHTEADFRKSMYYFFSSLREKGLTSFLITESSYFGTSNSSYNTFRPEYFLADGIIELGIIEVADGVKRYIQVKKMRGVEHKMDKNHITASKQGLSVLGPIYRSI